MGFELGSPGFKSNATEPKSRVPDAVCRRLYLSDTFYRIAVLFIDAMQHEICQPDLTTTADNLE